MSHWARIWGGLLAAAAALIAHPAAAAAARLTLIHGGQAVECRVDQLVSAETLRVNGPDGVRLVKLADIQQIDFAPVAGKPMGDMIVEPIGGGRLYGRIIGGDASSFLLLVRGLGTLALPLDRIRVASNAALTASDGGAKALADARNTRRDRDIVLISVADAIRPFPSLVRQMDETGVKIQWEEGSRAIDWGRIYAIVFAGFEPQNTPQANARAVLTDGSVVAGAVAGFQSDKLVLRTGFADAFEIATTHLARVEFKSDKLVYLSGREPAKIEKAGYFGQDWPVRFDVSLTGKPITLGKVVYKKGIAVHSRTAVHYDLGGEFKTFAATIGIDDETGGLGSVVFRVTDQDGKVLFDSGDHSAKDPPRTISVDVSGVAQLVLLVDYGKDLDIGDNAVWADARVIKP